MKKTITSALLLSVFALTFSCSKDDKPSTPPLSAIEEGKQQLEDNSIKMMDKIDTFHNDPALNDIVDLAAFLRPAPAAKSSDFEKIALNTLNNIAELKKSNGDVTMFNAKQATTLVAVNPMVDDYNQEKGIYEWNANIDGFEKTGISDDIIYKVSYTVNNNNKTAIFSFTDFNSVMAGAVGQEEEVPNLIKANLKIGNTVVFSQNFSASFQTGKLIPASIINTTTIGGFTFATTYSNPNNTKATQTFDFKIYDEVIIGFNYVVNGNFNNEDGKVEDIIDNATISFSFLAAKLEVSANDTGFNSDNQLTIDQQVALLNSNTSAKLSVNGKQIAKSLFYKDKDTYTRGYYDWNSGMWIEETVTEDIVNAKFLFEDGTTNDFETYIEGSFTELEKKTESVFKAYENLFSGVDM